MEIRLPKPNIKCPDCGHKIDEFSIDGPTKNMITMFSDCDNCGAEVDIKVKFEDDLLFCNCDICKQLNKDKQNEHRRTS